MRLFVTGGAGFLGRHLTRLAHPDHDVLTPPSDALDVRDRQAVVDAVRAARPDAVAHLAYRKGDASTLVGGSANVALAAAAADVRLVHLSTDVVFGSRHRAWREDEEPCPAHAYGRAKARAEEHVAAIAPTAVRVRTSLLYGDDDLAPIQEDVVAAIEGRSGMRFFTDEVRCPVHVDDVAGAVLRLADELAHVGGPLHLGGPRVVSRADLARRFAERLGLDPDLVPTASALALGLDRSRPLRVVLDSSRASALGLPTRAIG